MGAQHFQHDVFISYSRQDTTVVHALARRLREDGARVWLDEWSLLPGDLVGLKIQEALEQSRILLMCMSESYFGSGWAALEHHARIFRDPTNSERRLIPMRLDGARIPDLLAQYRYVDWRAPSETEYVILLTQILGRPVPPRAGAPISSPGLLPVATLPTYRNIVRLSFSDDDTRLFVICEYEILTFDIRSRTEVARTGSYGLNSCGAVARNGLYAVTGTLEPGVVIWDLSTGRIARWIKAHPRWMRDVGITPDASRVLSAADDDRINVWQVPSGRRLATFRHKEYISYLHMRPDGRTLFVSGGKSITRWDLGTHQMIDSFEIPACCGVSSSSGYRILSPSLDVSSDLHRLVIGSSNGGVCVFDPLSHELIANLVGHTGAVRTVRLSPDGHSVVSASDDRTVRVWDVKTAQCTQVIGQRGGSAAFSNSGSLLATVGNDQRVLLWNWPLQPIIPTP